MSKCSSIWNTSGSSIGRTLKRLCKRWSSVCLSKCSSIWNTSGSSISWSFICLSKCRASICLSKCCSICNTSCSSKRWSSIRCCIYCTFFGNTSRSRIICSSYSSTKNISNSWRLFTGSIISVSNRPIAASSTRCVIERRNTGRCSRCNIDSNHARRSSCPRASNNRVVTDQAIHRYINIRSGDDVTNIILWSRHRIQSQTERSKIICRCVRSR